MNAITTEMNLSKILEDMEVPERRKDLSKPDNLRWLQRNLQICNVRHKDFVEARKLIKSLLDEVKLTVRI